MIGITDLSDVVDLEVDGQRVLVGLIVLPFHIFSHDGRTFLYNVSQVRAFEIDAALASRLTPCAKADAVVPYDLLTDFHRLGLIADTPEAVARLGPTSERFSTYVQTLVLNVIQACNLRCSYCFAGDGSYGDKGKMADDTALGAIDWYAKQHNGPGLEINFFGGEPLANFPLIARCVDYGHAIARREAKPITFSLTTNATLVTREIAEFLANERFRVAVSIDGPPMINDRNRPTAAGRGSSRQVVAGIARLRQAGLSPIARCTVHGETDMAAVRTFFSETGFAQVHVSNATTSPPEPGAPNRASQAVDALVANAVLEREEALAASQMGREVENSVSKLMKLIRSGTRQTRACGIGERIASVGIDGGLYACHRFTSDPSWKIGDTATGLYQDRFRDRGVDDMAKCRDCWARYLCGGGCRHDNHVAGGDAFKPSDAFCREMMAHIEQAVVLACDVSNAEAGVEGRLQL